MIESQLHASLLNVLPANGRIVLALSGGLDSRVLLALLTHFQQAHPCYPIQVVHVHHGLSENADKWEKQCAAWTQQAGFEFHCERVVVDANDGGVEQGARRARYAALATYISPETMLLTAQHQDDQCETLLLALKRGSGPKGLSAMPALTRFGQGWHFRPLLGVRRTELEAYAASHHLTWVDDESNDDTRYERNFLRRDVIPLLEQRWPSITESISRSAQLCAGQESALQLLLADKLAPMIGLQGQLSCDALSNEPAILQPQLLRLWLSQQGCPMPSQAQLHAMLYEVNAAKSDANPSVAWHHFQLRRFQSSLWVTRQYQDIAYWQSSLMIDHPLLLPDANGELILRSARLNRGADREGEKHESNSRLVLGLRDALPSEPITVQFGVEGLKVQPVERQGGRRKMKKLFQEYAIPSWLRRRYPMVFYGEQLAAVAGLFVCRGYEGDALTLVWQPENH